MAFDKYGYLLMLNMLSKTYVNSSIQVPLHLLVSCIDMYIFTAGTFGSTETEDLAEDNASSSYGTAGCC